MQPTTDIGLTCVIQCNQRERNIECEHALDVYRELIADGVFFPNASVQRKQRIGVGGQGDVFHCVKTDSNGSETPIAVKLFSPERYPTMQLYSTDMDRIEEVASILAEIQNHNLLRVHDFCSHRQIRIMVMERIEGFNLRNLLTTRNYGITKSRVSEKRWKLINTTCATAGTIQPRLRGGVVICVLRDCLRALSKLHRAGVIHGDVKPSNIMLNRNGESKLVDIGSAMLEGGKVDKRACTPAYAPPELLVGKASFATDLKSLGYVAVELLCGRPLFDESLDLRKLIRAKTQLYQEIPDLLPDDIQNFETMLEVCQELLGVDEFRLDNKRVLESDLADELLHHILSSDLMLDCENNSGLWVEELLELGNCITEDELTE